MIDSTKISLASIHMAAHLHFWFVCPLEHFPVGSADGSSRLLDILPMAKARGFRRVALTVSQTDHAALVVGEGWFDAGAGAPTATPSCGRAALSEVAQGFAPCRLRIRTSDRLPGGRRYRTRCFSCPLRASSGPTPMSWRISGVDAG
ncbi:MAG: hypothetical protein M1115_09510, partial [Actinobacteria bacterium]|nr:hypothetical protein [Actinomycetota bacterium]